MAFYSEMLKTFYTKTKGKILLYIFSIGLKLITSNFHNVSIMFYVGANWSENDFEKWVQWTFSRLIYKNVALPPLSVCIICSIFLFNQAPFLYNRGGQSGARGPHTGLQRFSAAPVSNFGCTTKLFFVTKNTLNWHQSFHAWRKTSQNFFSSLQYIILMKFGT